MSHFRFENYYRRFGIFNGLSPLELSTGVFNRVFSAGRQTL